MFMGYAYVKYAGTTCAGSFELPVTVATMTTVACNVAIAEHAGTRGRR